MAYPYHGIDVSVMPIAQLIYYKRILGRVVDLCDIKELECLYSEHIFNVA
ncbi:hypothetical protein [Marinomonas atlantica]|nr:hypothetical protein [Marinomonas atlantica]MCO4786668.1 hypothetical protein [Marinomonas atlantica]